MENSKKNKEEKPIQLFKIFGNWLWIFALIVAIFNIIIVCQCNARQSETCFDYQGIIVGSFSLFVTVLVAWNIYSIIDVKNTKKECEEIKRNYDKLVVELNENDSKREKGYRQLEGMLYSVAGAIMCTEDTIYYLQSFEFQVYSLYDYILSGCDSDTVNNKLKKMSDLLERIEENGELSNEETFWDTERMIKEKGMLSEEQLDKFVEIIKIFKEKYPRKEQVIDTDNCK